MAETSPHIGKTLDDLKQQVVAKINEARRLLAAINTLEDLLGATKTTLSDLSGGLPGQESGPGETPMVTVNSPRLSANHVRPDEYLGDDPVKAAKKYIQRVGRAVHIDEITEAINKGGAAIKGSDWREKLLKSLTRSTYDVVKVQEGTFGLLSFYTEEQIKRLRATRPWAAALGRKQERKRGRPKKKVNREEQQPAKRTPVKESEGESGT